MNEDINGDGKKDTIKIFFPYDPDGYYDYTLQVNDTLANFWGDMVVPDFSIVDIKSDDGIKEMAVRELGPSDDPMTTFYKYDGKQIIQIGRIEGFYGEYPGWMEEAPIGSVRIDGSGIIKTVSRGDIPHTWYYEDKYKLANDHLLKKIPKELYEMDYTVTVLKPITLKKSMGSKENGITLNLGETVKLDKTDNKKWCSVVNPNVEVGWFEIYDYSIIKGLDLSADQVFNGLGFAD